MRRMLTVVGMAVVFAAAGCEWSSSSGSDGTTWSDEYNWLNFSGTYRAPDGGRIVTGIASNPDGTDTIQNESKGATQISQLNYSFSSVYTPLEAGSVSVQVGGLLWTDDGIGGLNGQGGGTISYQTGSITINGATVPDGTPILLSYQYQTSGTGTEGDAVVSLTVEQRGNLIQITDSSGRLMEGTLTSVQVPGGDAEGATSGQATANFEVNGSGIRIVGSLNGGYVANDVSSGSLTDRLIQGSWVEGSVVGDIFGVAHGTVILDLPEAEDDEDTETSSNETQTTTQ